jgi:hypothetical protein
MSTKKCGWTPNGPVVVAHQKYWCTTHKANFAARSSHRHRLIASQRFEPIFVHLGKVSNSTRLEHSTCYCNCTGLCLAAGDYRMFPTRRVRLQQLDFSLECS